MISLEQLFSSAPKITRIPSTFLPVNSADPSTPKPPKLENCSRDALFWFLVEKQIIDIHGNIIAEVPTEIPELTPDQKYRFISTLEEPIPVHDKLGRKGFDISFNEIIGYINEFYKSTPTKPKIELIGGWVTKILELSQDPIQVLKKFNIPGIEEFLKEHPLEEHFRIPPDRDLRIAIQGTTKEERRKLFDFILEKIGARTKRTRENLEGMFFTDFANPQDEEGKNCFLMFGMGDRNFRNIEVLAYDKLRRKELFSPENVKIAVEDGSISCSCSDLSSLRKVWQGLFDRLLQRTRVNDPDTLDSYIWFKSHFYALQGLTIADPKDCKIVEDKFLAKTKHEIEDERTKFEDPSSVPEPTRSDGVLLEVLLNESIKLLKKHCKAEPLNIFAYLHSVHEGLIKIGKKDLYVTLWESLKVIVPTFLPGDIELCKIDPSQFQLLNLLIHPLSWICSRGEGNAKDRECRIRATTQSDLPAIELVIKGCHSLTHSPEKRSHYSFWIPFTPKEAWNSLENAQIPENIHSNLFEFFLADLKIDNLFGRSDGFDWSEVQLLELAEKLISSESPEKFRLGFWILLVSSVKSPNLINKIFRLFPKYFYQIEKNPKIKEKAAQIFELVRCKVNPKGSSQLSELLITGDEDLWIVELINDEFWSVVGLELWKNKHPSPDKSDILSAFSKINRMNSAFSFMKFLFKEYPNSVDLLVQAIEFIPKAKFFQPALVSQEEHHWVIDILIQNQRKSEAVQWINCIGKLQNVSLSNWHKLLENVDPNDESSEEVIAARKFATREHVDALWNFASTQDQIETIEKYLELNLRHAFNTIASLENQGLIEKHFSSFKPVLLKVFRKLLSDPFITEGLMWEYLQAKNLIKKYPALFDQHGDKLSFLQQVLEKLRANIKDYENHHDPSWYIGLAQEYFGLFIQECCNKYLYSFKIPDCVTEYLEKLNYPSNPLTSNIKDNLSKLLPYLVSDLKIGKSPEKILKLYALWKFRNIPLAYDNKVRSALLFGYRHQVNEYSINDIAHISVMLEEIIKDGSNDEDDIAYCLHFIQFLKDPQIIHKIFTYLSSKVSDKKALLETIQKHIRRLIKEQRQQDALILFEDKDFEPKRESVSEIVFPIYVNELSLDASLLKGLNLLKNYGLPRNCWVILIDIVTKTGSEQVLVQVWSEYNNSGHSKLKPTERAHCLLNCLRRAKTIPGMVDKLVPSHEVIFGVFGAQGADANKTDGYLTYLEGALTGINKTQDNDNKIAKLYLIRNALIENSKDLTDGEKSRLVEASLDLMQCQDLDQISQLKEVAQLIPLTLSKNAKERISLLVNKLLVIPEKPIEAIYVTVLQMIKLLMSSSEYENVFDLCLKFCLQCKKPDFILEAAKSVTVLLKKNPKSANNKANSIKVLMYQLLELRNNRLADAYFNTIFGDLITLKLISDPEIQYTWVLVTQSKLTTLLESADLKSDKVDFKLKDIFNTLYNSSRTSFKLQIFKEFIHKFLEECLKKEAFHAMLYTVAFVEFYTFHSKDAKYLAPGAFITPDYATYQKFVFPNTNGKMIFIPSTNMQAGYETDKDYCEALIDFKIEYIDLFSRFFHAAVKAHKDSKAPNVFVRALILDFLYHQFKVIVQCIKPVSSECQNKVAGHLDSFIYIHDFTDHFMIAHLGDVDTLLEFDVKPCINVTNLLIILFQSGFFKNRMRKLIEYCAYSQFDEDLLKQIYSAKNSTDKSLKICDNDIALAIKALFDKFRNVEHLQSVVLQKLPYNKLTENHMNLLKLLEIYFTNFPINNKNVKSVQTAQTIMSIWSGKITAEILIQKTTSSKSHFDFFKFLSSDCFNQQMKAVNITTYLNLIIQSRHQRAFKCLQELFPCVKETPNIGEEIALMLVGVLQEMSREGARK